MVRRLFIRNRAENLEGEASPLVRLWALRMLVALGGHRKIMTTDGVREPWLLGLLGLSQWADDSAVSFKLASARSDLFDAHNAAEATSSEAELPGLLCANVTRIAALVGLDEQTAQSSRSLQCFIRRKRSRPLLKRLGSCPQSNSIARWPWFSGSTKRGLGQR